MGNLAIFSSSGHFGITLSAFALFLACCFFAAENPRIRRGIWYLAAGLLAELFANLAETRAANVFAGGGNINFYILVELTLLLASMGLLALAGSRMLAGNISDTPVIAGIFGLGIFAIIFSVYIIPDGAVVNNMRSIFPLAGFTYVAISFWSQVRSKDAFGYLCSAVLTTVASIYWAWKLAHGEPTPESLWYLGAVFYALLGTSLLLIRGDNLKADLRKKDETIEKCNNKIEEIIKLSPFPIIISRLSDDKILLANNNAVKLFGIVAHELERYHLKDFFADAENRKTLNERLEQEKVVQEFEILVKTPNSDTPFWLLASANIIDYNYDVALYSAFQDITSRKNREVLLKNQAIRDPLTSIFNRRYFEEEVYKQILNLQRENRPYSVLMMDADHFKNVNDTYGHKIGDKVLIELASTAERALRDNDIVARYGGEEFVAFLPDTDAETAYKVADRLRETISEIIVHTEDNQNVKFTVSIGVSSDAVSENVDMLIKTADEAMYQAKQGGRNRVRIFTKNDLASFSDTERKEESANHHPIFDKDEASEISLLDIPEN